MKNNRLFLCFLLVLTLLLTAACVTPEIGGENGANGTYGSTHLTSSSAPASNSQKPESVYTEGLEFTLTDGEEAYTVSAYLGDDRKIVVPASYNGKAVVGVAPEVFCNRDDITSVKLPDSIVSIGYGAFAQCSSLEEIVLSSGLEEIGAHCFLNCSALSRITLPSALTVLENAIFWGCSSLEEVVFPSGLTKIGDSCFRNCRSLSGVTLPNTVTSIEEGAFFQCSSLEEIVLPSGLEEIGAYCFADCTALSCVVLPPSLAQISESCFADCTALSRIRVPSSVTVIGHNAFAECSSLDEVLIEDIAAWCAIDFAALSSNPLHLAGGALYVDGLPLTDITLPESVTRLKKYVFSGNAVLTRLVLPHTVRSVDHNALLGVGDALEELTLPFLGYQKGAPTEAYLGYIFGATEYRTQRNFLPTSLRKVVLTEEEVTLKEGAFYGCPQLTEIIFEGEILSIGRYVFANCAPALLTEKNGGYYLGDSENPYRVLVRVEKDARTFAAEEGVRVVAAGALAECTEIESLTLPFFDSYAADIGYISRIFADSYSPSLNTTVPTTLTSVTLTEGTVLSLYAFQNCNHIQEITLSESIRTVKASAFSGCSHLERLYISSNIKSFDQNALRGCNALIYNETADAIYLGSRENPYVFLVKAKEDATSCIVHEAAVLIGQGAFSNCPFLTEVVLPSSRSVSCSPQTFAGLQLLYGTHYNGAVYIGSETNPYEVLLCTTSDSFDSYTVHPDTRTISANAFKGSSLKEIVLPSELVSIGNSAFEGCKNLKSVTLPISVSFIGTRAFWMCDALTEIHFGAPDGWECSGTESFSAGSVYEVTYTQDAAESAKRMRGTEAIYYFRRK